MLWRFKTIPTSLPLPKTLWWGVFSFLMGCERPSEPIPSQPQTLIYPSENSELFRNDPAGRLPECQGFPSKPQCDQGDGVLFNGLLCLSGYLHSCEYVKQSQDPYGRWWRSPLRAQKGEETPNSFSRDMAFGVMAYLLQTKDSRAAQKWVQWILGSGKGKLCATPTDNRCTFTPGFWNLMGLVWTYHNWPLLDAMTNDLPDEAFLPIQAQLAPPGFELHLIAVNLYLRKKMGIRNDLTLFTAKLLWQRESENPFFGFLAEEKKELLVALARMHCHARGKKGLQNQWYLERAQSQKAWLDSMGWDCVFLDHILLY